MRLIKESKNHFSETYYEVYLDNKLMSQIKITRVNKKYKDFQYMFLIDSRGHVIEKTFWFLNEFIREKALNTREVALNSLKILHSYLEVKNKTFEELDRTDIKNLSEFILGINIEGMTEKYEFLRSRSISTHNLYFAQIREYIKALRIGNEYFFEEIVVNTVKSGYGMLAHTRNIPIKKYRSSRSRHVSFSAFVPKYISIDEYSNIVGHIRKIESEYSLRNEVIIDLMYTRGMRLGEVLGITIEDIKEHPEDKNSGIIILRNRINDKKYQFAKGVKKADSLNVEYREIIIPPILMNKIKNYIDQSRNFFALSEKKIMNISKRAIADNVEGILKQNYYLFLNKNGKPLSSSGWNKTLKGYFHILCIHIDKENKVNNLSHRFRHGYAMYLIMHEKKDILYVQREMRHKSINSTRIYFNPTRKYVLKATKEVHENIIKAMKGIG